MGLKTCKTCGGQIAASATTCPHCGAQPPRWLAIFIGVAIPVALLAWMVSAYSSAGL